MTSLRQRLTWFLALGLAGLLVAAVAVIYPAARRWLTAEFDAALLAKARALTTLPEENRQGINLAFTERILPEYQRANTPEYFQVWLGNGVVQARSPSLGTNSLPRRVGTESAPAHWALTLPDGRAGRAVGIEFSLDDGVTSDDGSFSVVFAGDILELNRTLRMLLTGLVVGGVALLGLMVWVVGRATKAALRPMESLAREVTDIHPASLSKRFNARDAPAEMKPVVEQLNQLLKRLETAFAREQRFAANAAHELLTPVSELRVLAEAAAKWADDPAATAQFSADVRDTAREMERTIRALLALARAEANAADLHRGPVDVSALLEELRRSVEDRSRARSLSLEWQVTLGIVVPCDATQCRTIMSNLLDNAVEHTPSGGRMHVQLGQDADGFLFTVANSNSGLAAEDLPRLFEPFWRKDTARSDRAHAGLGLSLARACAEQLGWKLSVALPDGSVVRVELRGGGQRNVENHTRPGVML
jgi:signal transduction histidine kinase